MLFFCSLRRTGASGPPTSVGLNNGRYPRGRVEATPGPFARFTHANSAAPCEPFAQRPAEAAPTGDGAPLRLRSNVALDTLRMHCLNRFWPLCYWPTAE